MPEGDTIFRAAQSLRGVLAGQEVLAAASTVPAVRARRPERLVGQIVGAVEARGKHLLIWFEPSGIALHSHMRMTGSWHVYGHGEPWQKPERLARFTLEVAHHVAVCFSAPVVALLAPSEVAAHPSLAALGPDALDDHVDVTEALRRLRAVPSAAVGEVLGDQRVLAGVGNVYRNEVLYICRVDPWRRVGDLDEVTSARLVDTAIQLLRANVDHGTGRRVTTGSGGRPGTAALHVYGRARRPCPRCATPISVARQGPQARITYWCRRCQGPGPRRRA